MDAFENIYALLAFIAVYAFFVWVARKIAVDKGLDSTPYFVLAIVLTPLVGIIAAIVAKPKTEVVDAKRLAAGTERKCPFCAELVKREAIVCRFCGKDLPPPPAPVYEAEGRRFKTREEYEAWKRKQADFLGP